MNEQGICLNSQIPVRAIHSESSELVNQLIFGDQYSILERKDKWLFIQSSDDLYQGWIDAKLHKSFESADTLTYNGLSTDSLSRAFFNNGSSLFIPFGSSLQGLNYLTNLSYFSGSYISAQQTIGLEEIESLASTLLHSPYLWGGKTALGIDCSGFTQLLYRFIGINLPRDASQQVLLGKDISFIEESKAGDLAFFNNDEDKIVHVGLVLNNHRIIHASGMVRIDYLDHNGIFNKIEKKYTHPLKIIKRLA